MKRTTPLPADSYPNAVTIIAMAIVACLIAFVATEQTAIAYPGDTARGFAVSDIALYSEPDDSSEPVAWVGTGRAIKAVELDDGWFGASLDGVPVYFNDVENIGFYTATDTTVYHAIVVGGTMEVKSAPSAWSEVSRTLEIGSAIKFCQFNDEYSIARLEDGSMCFIPVWQARIFNPGYEGVVDLWVCEDGARAFEAPDYDNASVLAVYEAGSKLRFARFDEEWFMARASFEGVDRLVFVPSSDLRYEPLPTPEVDAGRYWLIMRSAGMGFSQPTWESEAIQTFSRGAVLSAVGIGDGWYAARYEGQEIYVPADHASVVDESSITTYYRPYGIGFEELFALENDGTWINSNVYGDYASPETLRAYIDPMRFAPATQGFFQFLVLSAPMGVPAEDLDAQLYGMGTLEGCGGAVAAAARDFGLNEAYIVAHAILETGYGSSTLAQGVWYDPASQQAVDGPQEGAVVVYNMFGYGAYDSDPLNGGARFAYEHGWTTPYAAVYGGAQYIASNYIYPGTYTMSGQDTLYEMLFHPEYADAYRQRPWHSYATGVTWAYTQTNLICRLLSDYNVYALTFEVPVYEG